MEACENCCQLLNTSKQRTDLLREPNRVVTALTYIGRQCQALIATGGSALSSLGKGLVDLHSPNSSTLLETQWQKP